MPSIMIRFASRKPDMPGIRTNQLYGMMADTGRPYSDIGTGMNSCEPIFSTAPRDSRMQPSQSRASRRVRRCRQPTTTPNTASKDSTRP